MSLLILVSFLSFVVLGLADGMLGVAWPSVSSVMGVSLGSLGTLMLAFTLGYVTTTALIGSLIARAGYRRIMPASALFLAAGGLVFALAPGWWILMLAMLTLGIGGGLLDGGLNAYGAAHFRPRDLNWLHACYGIGATLGPVIMTPLLAAGSGWRLGYGVYVAVALASAGFLVALRRHWIEPWDSPPSAARPTEHGPNTHAPAAGLRLSMVIGLSVVTFFLYTGLEAVTGQWLYSLLTLERGLPVGIAGTIVALYWGGLTAGRVGFGAISERVEPLRILRIVSVTAILGAVLLIVPGLMGGTPLPATLLSAAGAVILGLSCAPMFPLLIAETPRRVGAGRANHVIGVQIAAANLGAVGLISATGWGVELRSLSVIPWSVLGITTALVLAHEAVVAISGTGAGSSV